MKKIRDLTPEEYEAVCSCANECIEIIMKYDKTIHPGGIAIGEKYEDNFYRKVSARTEFLIKFNTYTVWRAPKVPPQEHRWACENEKTAVTQPLVGSSKREKRRIISRKSQR